MSHLSFVQLKNTEILLFIHLLSIDIQKGQDRKYQLKQYISSCYTSYIHVLLHKRGRVHFIKFVTVSRLQNKYLHLNK